MGDAPSAVEGLVTGDAAWKDRSVLVTGHTGFKGSWLSLWLDRLGADVHGYALQPPTTPNLFDVAAVSSRLRSDTRGDLAELDRLVAAVRAAEPSVVFHLAAQSLVRASYDEPLRTFASNVTGTAHLLEAVRHTTSVRAVVVVTTDKVYENHEWPYPYREADALGGLDPYSASKAAAEIVAASYRHSFFSGGRGHSARVATARAGNVIGGADWAAERLVPDCLRAFERREPVTLRYPDAVRPWQHVLEPLDGYLCLAERLLGENGARYATAWNFGPGPDGDATVGEVAATLARLWGDGASVVHAPSDAHPHEAGLLRLDSTRARTMLGWRPRWSLDEVLRRTVQWHRAWTSGANMRAVCDEQIAAFEAASPA